MAIQIRQAVQSDCPRLLELITELAVYEKEPNAVTVSPEHFAESGFGSNPVWWAICAEVNGSVVGFALYYVRYSTWKGQAMYLEDIIVTESMRGQGIGKMLMDALIEVAKSKGWTRMVWQVLEWNEPAINFYKKYGAKFETDWHNVILDL